MKYQRVISIMCLLLVSALVLGCVQTDKQNGQQNVENTSEKAVEKTKPVVITNGSKLASTVKFFRIYPKAENWDTSTPQNDGIAVYPLLLDSNKKLIKFQNIKISAKMYLYAYNVDAAGKRVRDKVIYNGTARFSKWQLNPVKIPYKDINAQAAGWNKEDAMLYMVITLPDGRKIAAFNSSVSIVPK